MVKCKCCGKELFYMPIFANHKTYPHINLCSNKIKKYIVKNDEENFSVEEWRSNSSYGNRLVYFCNEECKHNYLDSLLVERYKGCPIYKVGNLYVADWLNNFDLANWYDTIEEARHEIDLLKEFTDICCMF